MDSGFVAPLNGPHPAVCMEAVRRLPRRTFIDCSCACGLRASPAGGRFAPAGGIHPCAEGTPLPHCASSHDWQTVPRRDGFRLRRSVKWPSSGCAHGGGAPPAAADFHRLLLRMRLRASPAGGHFAPAGGIHPCAEGTSLQVRALGAPAPLRRLPRSGARCTR